MKRIKEYIRFPDVGGQDSGKGRAKNCVALSESRNNGGLRFREVKRNPISSLPRRREGLPVEDRGRESDGKRDERREEDEERRRRRRTRRRRREIDNGGNCVQRGSSLACAPSLPLVRSSETLRGKKREREYEGDR